MDPGRRVVRRVEAGAGELAVVLEAGANNGAASWQRVMPLLAPHVRVAAYDRAGIGGSAPAPGLVTIDRQIDDLASVITGLAAGPCVLAGHSLGRHPGPAAGLPPAGPGRGPGPGGSRGTRRWRVSCPCPPVGVAGHAHRPP